MEERSSTNTIVIVEDDISIGELLETVVASETCYRPVLVTNGLDALRLLQQNQPRPCLLLLDYNLPQMNGIDLYDHLRRVDGLEAVPTVIMSASFPEDEVNTRRLTVLHKPFDLDELLEVLEQQCA
jgi:DNA-binding response OmpR family regulator